MVLVTAAFEAGARATARARGFDSLPIVAFPADFEERSVAEQKVVFAAVVSEIERSVQRD